jgi:hypothetical protein
LFLEKIDEIHPNPPLKKEGDSSDEIPPAPFMKGGEDIEDSKEKIKLEFSQEFLKERGLIFNGYHLPYNPELKERSKELRTNMTKAEEYIWKNFLQKLDITINRQKPIDNFIADFYIASANLVIEID